jgi:hypothetical protein
VSGQVQGCNSEGRDKADPDLVLHVFLHKSSSKTDLTITSGSSVHRLLRIVTTEVQPGLVGNL